MPTAFLFPGQASQTPDMRDLVAEARPDLLELAVEVVGEDPFPRVADGTDYAQPAIFCVSLAGLTLLDGEAPDAVAGHSLGEFAALVAAGSLDEADALRLVALRGRLMQQSGEAAGTGGMLALLGDVPGLAEEVADRHGVSMANDNAPGQLVLSGDRDALAAAAVDARAGGLKALELDVAGAFHSPAMAAALPEFEAALATTEFRDPRVRVYSSVIAAPFDDVRRRLAEGLTSPVRWRETLLAMHADGIRRFVETGPGKVLSRLVGRTLDGVEVTTASRLAGARA